MNGQRHKGFIFDSDQCAVPWISEVTCREKTPWRTTMIDSQLRQNIIDEFEFDPAFDGEHIGVAVDENVVSLTGHVTSYAQKVAAIAAARRVKGVHAIGRISRSATPSRP